MRRITKISLAAMTALSLGAVAAAPAEAQPYWGPGGGYHRHHGPGPGADDDLPALRGQGADHGCRQRLMEPIPPSPAAPPPLRKGAPATDRRSRIRAGSLSHWRSVAVAAREWPRWRHFAVSSDADDAQRHGKLG